MPMSIRHSATGQVQDLLDRRSPHPLLLPLAQVQNDAAHV